MVFAPTKHEIESIIKGLIQGFGKDLSNTNVCILMFNYIYYAVCDVERILTEWNKPEKVIYNILTLAVRLYNNLVVIESGCQF